VNTRVSERRVLPCLLLLAFTTFCGKTATTPRNTKLAENGVTRIECMNIDPLAVHEGPYHYDLYIPEDYYKNTWAKYPVMFIASPGGNATMGPMKERFTRDRWIVVMLVESKNRSIHWHPNFLAAHDDVTRRVRVAENFKFATGMSGGARVSAMYPTMRSGFRGLVQQAAFFSLELLTERSTSIAMAFKKVAVFGTFGSTDFNLYESDMLRRDLPDGVRRGAEVFEGGHAWAPVETFERGMDWIERQVFMLSGPPPKSDQPGFLWYYQTLLRRRDAAETDLEKYEVYEQLNAVAVLSKLAGDKAPFTKQLAELKTSSKTLAKELKAREAFRRAVMKENLLNIQLQKRRSVWKDRKMSAADTSALDAWRKALDQAVKESGPDTAYGIRAERAFQSLKLEFGN
jgi:hypothetical protein